MILTLKNANIYTPVGNSAVKGDKMNELLHIPNGAIQIKDGVITYCGDFSNCPDYFPGRLLDVKGCVVLPGFIDSHTHLVFGGSRPDEFSWRLRGDSYMSIMQRGGGIANTMNATRAATETDLKANTTLYLELMAHMGVTTVEGKSGYGLDCDTEIKQLNVLKALADDPDCPVDIISTYLGAHALPPEYKGNSTEYVNFIVDKMIPEVASKRLAKFCDVFCEEGVFTYDETKTILQAAAQHNLIPKIHADEITNTKGAQLAASLNAISADHLLHVSDEGIEHLAKSNTVATLLPLTAFTLKEQYAPARKLIDSGCAVALATDFNPGSCFSFSIPLLIALSCIYMNMTIEETITALTINGAAALGIADKKGSIATGKSADLVILGTDNINILPYFTAMNAVAMTIKGGNIVANNKYYNL